MSATRRLCSTCGFMQAWCLCALTYPIAPVIQLRPHERRAADGSVHWWACRLFCPPNVADASEGCDCDTGAKERTLLSVRGPSSDGSGKAV